MRHNLINMKTILTRKTIRKYADKDVSEELLNRLMTEAARTQTMGNLQLYSVIVTRSKEMKEKLAPAHFNQPMQSIWTAPAGMVSLLKKALRFAQETHFNSSLSIVNSRCSQRIRNSSSFALQISLWPRMPVSSIR